MVTIGEKIKELRKEKNMSGSKLGRLLGVDKRTVSSMELNKTSVKSDYVYVLCEVFNVTPNDLFGYKNEMGGRNK